MPFDALNTSQIKQSSKCDESLKCVSKEAIEAEAIASFQKILRLQKDCLYAEAEAAYLQLLKGPFLASENGSKLKNGTARASIKVLKYCVLKNLGIICEKSSRPLHALDYYLMAAHIDDTDVTLWSTIGKLAESSSNISLTRYSYKMTQELSAEFAPSLMRNMYVLYACGNYGECLEIISNTLKKDKNFFGGLSILRLIFKFIPSLREEVINIAKDCKINLRPSVITEDKSLQITKELDKLKTQFSNQDQPVNCSILSTDSKILSLRWLDLGRYLVQVCKSTSSVSHGGSCNNMVCQVDIEGSLQLDADLEKAVTRPMDCKIFNNLEMPVRDASFNCEDMHDDVAYKASTDDHIKSNATENSKDGKEQEICAVPDGTFAQSEKKKGKKRKLSLMNFFDEPEYKRRSARVKNPIRSKASEMLEVSGTIKTLLPNCFHNYELDEIQDDIESSEDKKSTADLQAQSSKPRDGFMNFEEEKVLKFVKHHSGRCTLFEILQSYLLEVQGMFHLRWNEEMRETFMECFKILRNHSEVDFHSCGNFSNALDLTKICLVYLELKMDEILKMNLSEDKMNVKPHQSSKAYNSSHLAMLKNHNCKDVAGDFELQLEVQYLESAMREDLNGELAIRTCWVLARIYKFLNMLDDSLFYFSKTLEHLRSSGIELVELPNCKLSGVISEAHINEVMNHVEKSCSIEGVQKVFDRGEYRKVVDLLEDSSLQNDDLQDDEKRQQTLLLLESYAALGEFENCFRWIERAFNNAVKLICQSKDKSTMTIDVIKKCLNHLEVSLAQLGERVKHQKTFKRFTINLASFLEMVFEDPDFKHVKEFEYHAVFMWKLLYQLVKWREHDEKMAEDDVPHHLRILISGHDHLGRKAWCSLNDGEFLEFVVNELKDALDAPGNECFHDDIISVLEQAFHCLYGHPSKKSRGRYLEDHSSRKLPLDWFGGQFLYKLFRPECLPEYDSYKTSAISSECATLLLKLKKLAPKIDNFDELMKNIELYLNGASDQVPTKPEDVDPLVEEIFYLLADFYFKNGENKKAMKYYMRDLSLCPTRLDSWAALALIHSSFLTDLLSEHDVTPDIDISPHMKPGLRSFERALCIDKTCSKLWIEYGSFTYVLQSHFSYLAKKGLKKELDRDKMLQLSGRCFECARVNDNGSGEEWLEHYMLGKAAEKSDEKPEVFLQYYLKASEYLHLEKAKYPRRSFSYYNPPHLAVESLEMFYRMHASTLKYLIKHESRLDAIPFEVFEKYLGLSAESPLVQGTELQDKKRVESVEDKNKSNEAVVQDESADAKRHLLQSSSDDPQSAATSSSSGEENKPPAISEFLELNPANCETIREVALVDSVEIAKEMNEEASESFVEDHPNKNQVYSSTNNINNTCYIHLEEPCEKERTKDVDAKECDRLTCGVETRPSVDANIPSNAERFSDLLATCIRAFSFILSRYPWHFKSTYRLAYLFFHCKKLRNLEACRALLVGHNFAPIGGGFKCNGLFYERKPTNLFNGLWRLPSAELDRCGSFSSHLSRSVCLLCDLCRTLQDPRMLFFLHQQLARCPENAAKKYLRDCDREALSKQAFEDCCLVLSHQLAAVRRASDNKAATSPSPQELLTRIFNIRQQCFKTSAKHLDAMMLQIYVILFPHKLEHCPTLEEVKRFCIQQQNPRMYNTQVSAGHQINSNPDSTRNNQSWNQRVQQAIPIQSTSYAKREGSVVPIGSTDDGKPNASITSEDVEIIDEPDGSVTTCTGSVHPPFKQASHPAGHRGHNASKSLPSHTALPRQASGAKNPTADQIGFQRGKERATSGLPVQLKLAPEVLSDNPRLAGPTLPRQTSPRINQRPTFSRPTDEDEVIVLSEDSD